MPWRLIAYILVFAVFLTFIVFNLENRCDISFGFKKLENVPVFITIFVSFALGLVCTLPFALFARKPRKEPVIKDKKPAKEDKNIKPEGPYGID
jgi:uncharacterized integral membrane protein